MREKYNPDNIFKNREKTKENAEIIAYKESFFSKIIRRIKKQNEFVEETSVIVDKLLDWKLECLVTNKKPSREAIEHEYFKFFKLAQKGKEDGIADGYLFYKQGRVVIEAFKLFEDVVPEFERLK